MLAVSMTAEQCAGRSLGSLHVRHRSGSLSSWAAFASPLRCKVARHPTVVSLGTRCGGGTHFPGKKRAAEAVPPPPAWLEKTKFFFQVRLVQ